MEIDYLVKLDKRHINPLYSAEIPQLIQKKLAFAQKLHNNNNNNKPYQRNL